MEALYGLLLPFLGTSLGAASVFFMKKAMSDGLQKGLTGFAAGVMTAASVWSLLIPAIERSEELGKWSFAPAAAGLWLGFLFLLALDHIIPHLHWGSAQPEGPSSRLRRTTMMVLAVTLHNIPEGMAVGVVCAGYLAGDTEITAMGVLALSLGIAVQNFPEGAIVSMPLRAEGEGKLRAFAGGVLSGVVEPIGALVTILAAELLVPALPYLLGGHQQLPARIVTRAPMAASTASAKRVPLTLRPAGAWRRWLPPGNSGQRCPGKAPAPIAVISVSPARYPAQSPAAHRHPLRNVVERYRQHHWWSGAAGSTRLRATPMQMGNDVDPPPAGTESRARDLRRPGKGPLSQLLRPLNSRDAAGSKPTPPSSPLPRSPSTPSAGRPTSPFS